MSFPNDGQGSGGSNPNPAFNPALLNANAALANFNLSNNASGNPASNPNLPPAVQQQISNFNPAQLARLTEFHRQIPQQNQSSGQVPAVAPVAASRPPSIQNPPPHASLMLPQHVLDVLRSPNMTSEQKNDFFARWLKTDEGRVASQQHRQAAASQAAHAAGHSSNTAVSSAGGAGGARPTNPASGSPSSRPASFVSPQSISGNLPAQQTSSNQSVAGSGLSSASAARPTLGTNTSSNRPTGFSASPNFRPQQQLTRPPPSALFTVAPSVPPGWDGPARRAASPEHSGPRAMPAPRRREEGMRGTMRSELARLMYASGDVENPDLDTIDYMEDLVVDWLADLCAPPPPVRSHPSAPLVAPRLDYNVIRHRLSRPSMRKYLDRFEYMEYKAVDMRSARRVARGNFEPVDQKDLDRQLEKGFLDAEDSGQAGADGAGVGQARKKRKYTRAERPPANAGDGNADGSGAAKERKKPGPKKGWKAGLGDERARKIKRARQSTGPSVSSGRGPSVKPEE